MSSPAPSQVTVAVPRSVAAPLSISSEVPLPVTHIPFMSNSPLPAPVACDGKNARHSKSPPWASAWKANVVVTGNGEVPPVPPSIIVLPAPETRPCLAAPPTPSGLAVDPITTRATSATPAQTHRPSGGRNFSHPGNIEVKHSYSDMVHHRLTQGGNLISHRLCTP